MKFVAMVVMALVVIAAAYLALLGVIKLCRSFAREKALDEAYELRQERQALEGAAARLEALRKSQSGPRPRDRIVP